MLDGAQSSAAVSDAVMPFASPNEWSVKMATFIFLAQRLLAQNDDGISTGTQRCKQMPDRSIRLRHLAGLQLIHPPAAS
jgi:hypothetical protein